MAINDIVQTIAEARVDARSLSEFVFKPANFTVTRRLAPSVRTLQYYIDIFDNLDSVFSSSVTTAQQSLNSSVAEAQGKVAYIESTVQDAINSTAVEGGVLADTFLTVTENGQNTIARTQRDINAESVSIHSFGECGVGGEDTEVWNTAMLTLSTLAKADGMPRVLRLIAGKTYTIKLGKIKPLVDIVCEGGLATIKRVDVPVGTDEAVAKWWRVLETYTTRADWVTAEDFSHRANIKNIIFDGNFNNAQWTRNSYTQEQASCLFLGGASQSDGDLTKRLKFKLDNVYFKDSVSDGLHCSSNVDVVADNCFAEKCFRGGLVITGGNTIVKVKNWTAKDARLDTEIDGAGTNGSYTSYIRIRDYWQDEDQDAPIEFAGGIDIGSVGQGGILDFDNVNVYTAPFNMFMARTGIMPMKTAKEYNIRNSVFTINNSAVYNPIAATIKDTTFRIDNREGATTATGGLTFLPGYGGYTQDDITDLVFDNVKFELLSDDPLDALQSGVIGITSQVKTNKARLKVINSDFSNIVGDTALFWQTAGGRMYFDNIKVNTKEVFVGSGVNGGVGSDRDMFWTFGNIEFGDNVQYFARLYVQKTEGYESTINFLPNFTIPQRVNKLAVVNGGGGIFTNRQGTRHVIGSEPPTIATQGYVGDTYSLDNAVVGQPCEWVAVVDMVMKTIGAEWRATKWVMGEFATADLPVLTTFDIGAQNIDTTLNKVVTWSGTEWV